MHGAFACPECGNEIDVPGASPGRQVRCGWCNSLVEVPFIPRGGVTRTRRASKRRRPWWAWKAWPVWARLAVGVLVLAVGLATLYRAAWSWQRAAGESALTRLLESSTAAEKAGRLDEALVDLEAALSRAAKLTPPPPELDQLRRRRDDLSAREVTAQLAALEHRPSADPSQAVGRALTLRARAARDPALVGLGPAIDAALARARTAWADADAAEAARALEEGRVEKAVELCERQYRTADELPTADRRRIQARATDLARRVIARHGAIVEPVRGQFAVGTSESYATQLAPAFRDGLRAHGYLPQPVETVWPELWKENAPFRMEFDVVERQEDTYLQSPNRLTFVSGTLRMLRAGHELWHDTPNARTQVPVPGLPALQASRAAVSAHRSPEIERLLYDNARAVLKDRLGLSLRNLPAGPAPEPPGSTAAAGSTP